MIFRQLFDQASSTYTYLLASRAGGEALIIDPVLERCERYLQLLEELDLRLVKAVDTHIHADHITGLGQLRDATQCITVMGEKSKADVVSMQVREGDNIEVEGLELEVLYTPGHTDDSYSFLMPDRVFTGDALLIRGTGRTDFQNGDAYQSYDSLFNKLLKLPDDTLVYPAHDYKGDTVSTIEEEKHFNPRLRVNSAEEYAEIMNNLNLPDPKMMDVAVPANLRIGMKFDDPFLIAASIPAAQAIAEDLGRADVLFVDLREQGERQRDGIIPGSLHVPYVDLAANIKPGGLLHALAARPNTEIMFYCAFGERSALALKGMFDAGCPNARHLAGGIDAWTLAGGPLDAVAPD